MSLSARTDFARTIAGAALIGLSLGACSTSPEVVAVNPEPPVAVGTPATDTEMTDYLAAVQRTDDAAERRFTATVRVTVDNGVVQVEMAGQRVGASRTLDVTTGDETISYAISPDGATVDRGDGPVAIALTEVPNAPSLSALLEVQSATILEPGILNGTLEAAQVLGATGNASTVSVQVRYEPGGFVTGLEMRALDGTFTAIVAYVDVVA